MRPSEFQEGCSDAGWSPLSTLDLGLPWPRGGGPWEAEGAGSRAAAAKGTEVNRTCLCVGHTEGEDRLVFANPHLP